MQPSKPAVRTPLRERNHVPRKQLVVTGNIYGVRPLYLVVATLSALALVWFLYGWWTYPIAP